VLPSVQFAHETRGRVRHSDDRYGSRQGSRDGDVLLPQRIRGAQQNGAVHLPVVHGLWDGRHEGDGLADPVGAITYRLSELSTDDSTLYTFVSVRTLPSLPCARILSERRKALGGPPTCPP
jgi:hypothetical protein